MPPHLIGNLASTLKNTSTTSTASEDSLKFALGCEGTRDFRVLQNPNVPQGKVLKNSEWNSELFNTSRNIGYFQIFFLLLKNPYFLCIILMNSVILMTLKRNLVMNRKSFQNFLHKQRRVFFFAVLGPILIHKYKIFESSEECSEFLRYFAELRT